MTTPAGWPRTSTTASGTAVSSALGLERSAEAWMGLHPGWRIEPCVPSSARVLDPSGTQQITMTDLGVLLDGLERAELRVETEQEQLALLREAHPGESVVVDHGKWESTRHGIDRVAAPCAWLLEYRLARAGR